jgi:hypothetical protein
MGNGEPKKVWHTGQMKKSQTTWKEDIQNIPRAKLIGFKETKIKAKHQRNAGFIEIHVDKVDSANWIHILPQNQTQ